jgi:hypothetical protein
VRYFCGLDCRETVAEPYLLTPLGMQSERKQIPQVVENIKRRRHAIEPLEGQGVRPRQVRYQAALRPDTNKPLDSTAFYSSTAPPPAAGLVSSPVRADRTILSAFRWWRHSWRLVLVQGSEPWLVPESVGERSQ